MARQSARKEAQDKKNLRPGEYKLTLEEQKKGGIASGKARRERKAFRELMQHYLDEPAAVNGKKVTRKDVATVKAVQMLTEKDLSPSEFVRLFEMVRDTIGEKPQERVEVSTEDSAKFNELLEQLEAGD